MTVWLVGAGPGDPRLLTLRGRSALERAEVVVLDRLVHPALLSLAPEDVEVVDVGKRPGDGSRQERIDQLLVELGRTGKEVVRLKGGDPFLFGRGGEEAAALGEAGVPFVVVPGVSSALAVPASVGVPVTFRGHASVVSIATGHVGGSIDWAALGSSTDTLVVLMGVEHRQAIADALIAGGRDPLTPVAAITRGTYPDASVVRTTLAGLGGTVLEAPTTLVVGDVAGLELAGVADGPLAGRSVALARVGGEEGLVPQALKAAGAWVVSTPLVELADASDGGAGLERALSALESYDWLVLTSAQAVPRVLGRVGDLRRLASVRLAVAGPSTAAALRSAGFVADLVPEWGSSGGDGVVDAFPEAPAAGGRVLYPRSAEARPVVAEGLAAKGWTVDEVDAYAPRPRALAEAKRWALEGCDALVLSSPSALRSAIGVPGLLARLGSRVGGPRLVCTGPTTAEAAADAGVEVAVAVGSTDPEALVEALVQLFDRAPAPAVS